MTIQREVRFDENRKFGVEIEFNACNGGHEALVRKMREKGLECSFRGYTHENLVRAWKVVTDASCGLELVSPPLKGMNGINQVKLACEALNEVGAKVDKRCGLHVHHDAADFTVKTFKNLYGLYIRFEESIDSVMPISRRGTNGQYCKSLRSFDSKTYESYINVLKNARSIAEIAAIFSTRYLKLNCQSYTRHGTVEFRQHSGTIDFDKMMNWIILTNVMVTRAQDGIVKLELKQQFDNWESFKRAINAVKSKGADEMVQKAMKFFDKRRVELIRTAQVA